MMIKQEYEYQYQDNNLTNAHSFLMNPLLSILSEKSQPGAKILDLGCGNGSLSNVICQHGYEVVGMEESPSGVAIANNNFPNCRFIQGSIYDSSPPELENAFDVVISVEVIEHLFYPKELVKLARKFLKPGGYLILTTPYHGYLKNLALALSGKMDNHFTVLWDGGHIKFFSVKTLTQLLESEGYTDIKFKFAGRTPYLWKSMLCSSTPK
ncbi:class I SAM-dependent methyltransferase [Anabaena sphaerica FACHB-251]|uniref:Class I SAM-dependent methyltransferase n=1 Tax=Anabaena sphaerica FACHB-251 TaxID=2692883 RepID=A0A926WD25_9NOST|nr:class I SAM-dependent methyltransferase [Anabaena sphaerica]MBD2292365.1 class I SAM-dependent methyltransferase [Anabaena sphaerica FACHB-251]